MKHNTSDLVRNLLLECRTWIDGYGHGHTGACLWINGGFVGFFGVAYGRADDLEHYRAAPYLESVGVIPGAGYIPRNNRRVRGTGVIPPVGVIYSAHRRISDAVRDYYKTDTFVSRRRDAYPREQLPSRAELWELLVSREQLRARRDTDGVTA